MYREPLALADLVLEQGFPHPLAEHLRSAPGERVQPGTTGLVRRQASAIEDLKTIAISRLVFDNVAHIKSYWIMLGQDTAGVAINFGASDLDGTIGQEKIAHAALARSPVGMAEDAIVRLIREAGKTAVQRDALYNVVREYDAAATGAAAQ